MPIRRGLAIHERESVGNSIQLIREVGYFQEYEVLDSLPLRIQNKKRIFSIDNWK